MTDDLQSKFAVLTDARPEPPDPAAPIRLRIKRRQRRRRGTAVVLVTAAAVALTVAAGPALGALHAGPREPGFAGPPTTAATPTPGATLSGGPTPAWPTDGATTDVVLPAPWSAKKFTKLPDANAYRPAAFYVAEGRIPTETWAILSTNESCLVADEGNAVSFGRPYPCFTDWEPGQRIDYFVQQASTSEKSEVKLNHTLVLGATSIEARSVRIVAGGKAYVTDAVGTPTTARLRFFAIDIPQRDLKITSITPLDAAGRPAPAPADPPTSLPCEPPNGCGTLTPAGGTPSK